MLILKEVNKFMQHTHGGNITHAKKKYGLKREEILDFSANINPLGLSKRVREALLNSIDSVVDYPDPDCAKLKNELSKYLKISYDNIIIGNGAAEIIYLVARHLGNIRGKNGYRTLIPAPTFAEYASAVAGNAGEIRLFPLYPDTGFRIDFDELATQARGCDAVFICNPNNPTGNLVEKGALLEFSRKVATFGGLVIIDEAFMDFVENPEDYSLIHEVKSMNNVIILGSLTKFFALPGLRLGYAVGTTKIIREMEVAKDPWSVNVMAQVAGIAALGDTEYIEETLAATSSQKGKLARDLSLVPGFKVFPPSVNFVLVNCRNTGITAGEIARELGNMGVLIRDCSNYPLLDEYYFRVAVRTGDENKTLVEGLLEAVKRKASQLNRSK